MLDAKGDKNKNLIEIIEEEVSVIVIIKASSRKNKDK